MDNNDVQLVGSPCGQHGPYTFYKAFRFTKNGAKRIMTLSEFFFVKLWMDSDLVCIGELQLLWIDKNSEQVLASLRLYFLPENTPEGRMDHGEDEVLAISEKVVLRVEDLITWITVDADWSWGRLAKCVESVGEGSKDCLAGCSTSSGSSTQREQIVISPRLTETALDFSDVEKERKLLDIKPPVGPAVIILSYPRYCRYRAVMKRLEGVEDEHLRQKIVYAIGGIKVRSKNTRILFCKDTFDYPELEGHELLCNHLAPKLKGRPRGKRKKRSISPGSESNESESSVSNVFNSAKNKIMTEGSRNGLRCDSSGNPRRSTRSTENTESKDFIKQLTAFMKSNHTPMGRIPSLGYKELDLYLFYTKVQKLGGYDSVTANRLWKSIFDDLSGNQASTSAATVIRRHYERFLLAYERHIKGEEYKPLPISERRRLKSKAGSSSTSDTETSEGASRSGNTTPIPHTHNNQLGQTNMQSIIDTKDFNAKLESKPSSLRSVRVKQDRLREKSTDQQDLKEEKLLLPPEKHQEPTTGAVAPVQKPSPEKSMSPAEGKENIPLYNARDGSEDDDLIEVPYKPKSPEIIDLESDVYASKTTNNNNNNTSNNNHLESSNTSGEVKKGKLDILKEGGLEVTPVRSYVGEPRPSVIQAVVEKPIMPPPSINATLIKRPVQLSPSLQISPKTKFPVQSNFGYSPPKVVQSKSIYAPSQKTVYGDPKDLFGPQIHQGQAPKFVGSLNKQPGMDLLDLTVRSPQKPVVEIMRVPPTIPSPKLNSSFKDMYGVKNYTPALPLLEGRRISSNLEITLVGPSKQQKAPAVQNYKYNQNNINVPQGKMQTQTHKRSIADYYMPNKMTKLEENGRTAPPGYPNKPINKQPNKMDINIPKPVNPYIRHPSVNKQDSNKYATSVPTSMYPNFMPPHPPSSNKNVHPYLPVMDHMYYQALQNICSQQTQLNQVNPMFPIPTPEQLQLYSEIMSRNARIPFPFSQHFYPPENHSSMTLDNKVKKQ